MLVGIYCTLFLQKFYWDFFIKKMKIFHFSNNRRYMQTA